MNIVWKVKNIDKELSDRELIYYIKKGIIKADSEIYNNDLKKYVYLKDTVYSFYLEKKEDYEKKD